MIELTDSEPRLRNVWHPAPEGSLIVTPNVTLNVFEGPVKGQINTGDLVDL